MTEELQYTGLCKDCIKDCKVRCNNTYECTGFRPDRSKTCIITNYQTHLQGEKIIINKDSRENDLDRWS